MKNILRPHDNESRPGKILSTAKITNANQEASKMHGQEVFGRDLEKKTGEPGIMEAKPASHTPAHNVTTTVAPFRAWRGS